MAKKKKVIKRIYEKGRETTVFSPKKPKRRIAFPAGAVKPLAKRKPEVSLPKISPQPVRPRPLIDQYELIPHYGPSRLTLMVKDPFWLYAYWEIAPEALEALKNQFSPEERAQAQIVLRLYDVTLVDFNGHNANYYFDIEVGSQTHNWYIKLWNDNASYVGELGLRSPEGRFLALTRSNCVQSPRRSYSPRTEQIWMKVTPQFQELPYVVPQIEPSLKRALAAQPALKPIVAEIKKKGPIFYISEEDLKQYYTNLSPLLKEIISSRIEKVYGRQSAQIAFRLEGESEEERREILAHLPKEYLVRTLLLGASEQLVLIGASEQLVKVPGGASESVTEKIKQPQFFFELDTELIVYGRTEPKAEVWLGNKKISLRPDGTFSLRFALPDGKIPLKFKALSFDKKRSRKISTYVERQTHLK